DIHMRQEFALHRWDLIGDDDEGDALLGQPELLEHSVGLLDHWLLARGLERDASVSDPFHARIRCAGERDVVLTVENCVGSLSFATPLDGVDLIETDAAGRLLLIWGRQPADSRRVLSTMPADHLVRFCALLSGF
ncbi:MAG: hypothetical protein ABI275_08280, partial [Terrimesophilobacter sp.]